MDLLRRAAHIGFDLQLRTEFVAHRLKQRIMANFDEVEGIFHRGEHEAVLIQTDGLLVIALHQPTGTDVAAVGVERLHQAGVLRQMPHRLRAGFFRVGDVNDQILLIDDMARGGNDILHRVERFLDRIDPRQIDSLDELTVGKPEFVLCAGNRVHKKLVKVRAADCTRHAADKFRINRVNQRRLLLFLCHSSTPKRYQLFFFR